MPRLTTLAARPVRIALAGLAFILVAAVASLRSDDLVADLSHYLVPITTAFTGTDLLVFGVRSAPENDVVVVARGPSQEETVRRKTRVGFLWLNTEEVTFENVPAFLAIAANRPLEEIARPAELTRYRIGSSRLGLQPKGGSDVSPETAKLFAEALVRAKKGMAVYGNEIAQVTFMGDRLFRTTLTFPALTPPGTYQVQTHEFRDGRVVGIQSSSLVVSKVGLEARLYSYAHQHAMLYGLFAILAAVLAGLAASLVFQKR